MILAAQVLFGFQFNGAWRKPVQREHRFQRKATCALAIIEGAEPKNEVEGALAVQMACTHSAATNVLARLGGGHGGERHIATISAAASRLLRAYATQVEADRRLRCGVLQLVRVEHVHVNEGGEGIIGNVTPGNKKLGGDESS